MEQLFQRENPGLGERVLLRWLHQHVSRGTVSQWSHRRENVADGNASKFLRLPAPSFPAPRVYILWSHSNT